MRCKGLREVKVSDTGVYTLVYGAMCEEYHSFDLVKKALFEKQKEYNNPYIISTKKIFYK